MCMMVSKASHTGASLHSAEISDALSAWRVSERQWELTQPDDPGYRGAAIAVISAWLRYQELTDPEPGVFVLVADEDHSYVAVGGGVKAALDYDPADLLGRRVEDIAAPELGARVEGAWQRFLEDGRQDGEYRLMSRDGRSVELRFQARAHHPIPGFHTSRLWPADRDRLSATVESG
jgi:PAS domain-containing protein